MMEGTTFSAIKTGAMAGLVSDLLADQNARELTVIGCGEQAKSQISAIFSIRAIDKISLFSRTTASALALQQWVKANISPTVEVTVHSSVAQAVATADIISTCTSKICATPLFSHQHIKPGVHINAIGGASLEAIEVNPDVLANAGVFVEDQQAALTESNEIRTAIQHQGLVEQHICSIGELLTSTASLTELQQNTSYFRSVGIAVQDAAIAGQIYQSALSRQLGQVIQM